MHLRGCIVLPTYLYFVPTLGTYSVQLETMPASTLSWSWETTSQEDERKKKKSKNVGVMRDDDGL